MASPADLEQRVLRVIQQRLAAIFDVSPSAIRRDTRLREDLNADSFELLELLIELQEQLRVIITDDEAATLVTVGDVVAFYAKRLSPPGTRARQQRHP